MKRLAGEWLLMGPRVFLFSWEALFLSSHSYDVSFFFAFLSSGAVFLTETSLIVLVQAMLMMLLLLFDITGIASRHFAEATS